MLHAHLALATTAPPLLLQGSPVEVLPHVLSRVPAGTLPVVIPTWALSRFSLDSRLRFVHHSEQAAERRTVAWVSVEGVGSLRR